ncbi:hypothetical protein BKA93DRAFT_152102 [Sparassis latifolia]
MWMRPLSFDNRLVSLLPLSYPLLLAYFRCAEHPTNENLYSSFPPLRFFRPTHFRSVLDFSRRRTERPMKIEIVLDPSRPTPPASLASRVAPAPAAAAPTEGARLVLSPRGLQIGVIKTNWTLKGLVAHARDVEGVEVGEDGVARMSGRPRVLLTWMLRWRITLRATLLLLLNCVHVEYLSIASSFFSVSGPLSLYFYTLASWLRGLPVGVQHSSALGCVSMVCLQKS